MEICGGARFEIFKQFSFCGKLKKLVEPKTEQHYIKYVRKYIN